MADTKISPLAGAVAREVYRRMLATGLTQKGLAIRAGLNPTYVRDLFMGKSQNPTAGNLHKLARALGCEIGDLAPRLPSDAAPQSGEFVQDPDELAWLSLWRSMTLEGRTRLTGLMFREAETPTGGDKINDR